MAGRIILDLTRVSHLDLRSRSRPLRMPGYAPPPLGQETALRSGLTAFAKTGAPNSGLAKDILSLQDRSKRLSVGVIGSIAGTTLPGAFTAPAGSSIAGTAAASGWDLTIGWGWGVSVSAFVITSQLGAGVYLWLPRGQIGLYGGGGFGPTLFATGFSGNVALTVLFGPAPTMLGGFSLLTGFDLGGAPTGGITFGFALVWSLKWELEGFCVNLGAGMSANWLAFDVYFEVNATVVKPLFR